MTSVPVHTIESAPERSKPALHKLPSVFGNMSKIQPRDMQVTFTKK